MAILDWIVLCNSERTTDDDYVLGLFAQKLGFKEDAEMFSKRGKNYANVWSPKVLFSLL